MFCQVRMIYNPSSSKSSSYFQSLVSHLVSGLQLILGSVLQVCTFIFLGEMILKLIAFKFRGYIKSHWNIFDGVVVVISLIDTVLTLSNLIDNTGTSVLRSFRLVSILIKSFKMVQNIPVFVFAVVSYLRAG